MPLSPEEFFKTLEEGGEGYAGTVPEKRDFHAQSNVEYTDSESLYRYDAYFNLNFYAEMPSGHVWSVVSGSRRTRNYLRQAAFLLAYIRSHSQDGPEVSYPSIEVYGIIGKPFYRGRQNVENPLRIEPSFDSVRMAIATSLFIPKEVVVPTYDKYLENRREAYRAKIWPFYCDLAQYIYTEENKERIMEDAGYLVRWAGWSDPVRRKEVSREDRDALPRWMQDALKGGPIGAL